MGENTNLPQVAWRKTMDHHPINDLVHPANSRRLSQVMRFMCAFHSNKKASSHTFNWLYLFAPIKISLQK
jgi:hypothetical protein